MYQTAYIRDCPQSNVKVKLSLCLTKHHAMMTYWGSGGTDPRISP